VATLRRESSRAALHDVASALQRRAVSPVETVGGVRCAKHRMGLATNKPAEFIVLRISQDTRALEAELAAAGA